MHPINPATTHVNKTQPIYIIISMNSCHECARFYASIILSLWGTHNQDAWRYFKRGGGLPASLKISILLQSAQFLLRPFLTSDENENKISSFHFHFHFVGPYQAQKWINHVLSFHLIFSNKNSYLFDYSKNWKWKLYMANFVWNENSTSPTQSYGSWNWALHFNNFYNYFAIKFNSDSWFYFSNV